MLMPMFCRNFLLLMLVWNISAAENWCEFDSYIDPSCYVDAAYLNCTGFENDNNVLHCYLPDGGSRSVVSCTDLVLSTRLGHVTLSSNDDEETLNLTCNGGRLQAAAMTNSALQLHEITAIHEESNCTYDPCVNGRCLFSAAANSTVCFCDAGYTGQRCQTGVNYCIGRNTCRNGGTCRNLTSNATFLCICATGFAGRNCDTRINYCRSSPCLNGGTCTRLFGSYNCTCRSGWVGVRCQTRNFCAPWCKHGICQYIPAERVKRCKCNPGYDGLLCADTYCQPNPCKHGGRCSNRPRDYVCSCPNRWIGKNCHIENFCYPNPCRPGQTCRNGRIGYQCIR